MFKIFLTLSILTFTLNASEPTTKSLINNMIKAYGGEKSIKRASSYEQIWQIDRQTDGVKGTDKRKVIVPNYLKTELIYPKKIEVRTLTNATGTKEFSGRKVQARGPMLDAMKLQRMRLFNPIILRDNLKDITLIIEKDQYKLSLKSNSITSNYFVSKKNFLIEKVVGELRMGSMSMSFLTIYQNYKPVYGVMMHHKEIKYAGNVNTAIMTLKETKFVQPDSI